MGPVGPAGQGGPQGIPGNVDYPYAIDAASAAVAVGDCLCITSTGTVTRAVLAALNLSGAVLGVATTAGTSGQTINVKESGQLTPAQSGVSSFGPVRCNTTTGRLEQVASFSSGDYPVGFSNASGYVTMVRGIVLGGGGGFTAGGDLTGNSTSQQVVSLTGSGGTLALATTAAVITWAQGTAAPGLLHAQAANAVNPQNTTITPQAPGAAATNATTGTPGSLMVALALPVTGGTEAFLGIARGVNTVVRLGPYPGSNFGTIWCGVLTPSGTNYTAWSDGATTTCLNAATGTLSLRVAHAEYAQLTTAALQLTAAVNLSVGGAGSFGGGTGVLCMKAAATNPSSSPTNAYVQYALSASGLPAIYGPAAMIGTTVGAAGAASAMPTPVAYEPITINGVAYRRALFN